MLDMIPGSRSIDFSSSLAERDRIIHIGDDVGHLFIQVQKITVDAEIGSR